MPLTDLQFVHVHRKKQRWDARTHKPIPYFTLCIRKKALQRLKGKHLLLVADDIGNAALKQCKVQAKMNAAGMGDDKGEHWAIADISDDDAPVPAKGVIGCLQEASSTRGP